MKKLLIACICIMFMLSGCVYSSVNLIRAQGTDLDIQVNPMMNSYSCKGKDVALTIFRQSGVIKKNKDGSVEKPVTMPDITETPQEWKLDNAPQKKEQ